MKVSAPHSAHEFNVAEVTQYFKFFFGVGENGGIRRGLHYGFWADAEGEVILGLGAVPVSTDIETLKMAYSGARVRLGGGDPTLHICLNTTNLVGRKTENIVSVNVFCVDLDRQVSREEIIEMRDQYGAHCIVESSPGKYHIYWKAARSVRLDEWARVQRGLAWKLDGDRQMSALAKTIRVPGFRRVTKGGKEFEPRVVWRVPTRALGAKEYGKLWPWLPEAIEESEREIRVERDRVAAAVGPVNSGSVEKLARATDSGLRNERLYSVVHKAALNGEKGMDEAAGVAVVLGEKFNAALSSPLEDRERDATIRSALRHAADSRIETGEVLLNGHIEPKPASATSAEGEKGRKRKKRTVPVHKVPKTLQEAARFLARRVWRRDRENCVKIIRAALKTQSYQGFSQYFISQWKFEADAEDGGGIGNFSSLGPLVYRERITDFGTNVMAPLEIGEKEAWLGFVSEFVNEVYRLRAKRRAGIVPPKQGRVNMLAETSWRLTKLQGEMPTQPRDVVALQDGVLGMGLGFERARYVPMKASNALWCEWSDAADSRVRRALESGVVDEDNGVDGPELAGLLEECCPVFFRFLDSWFPGDISTWAFTLAWYGYCMTVDTTRQQFVVLYGPTRAGKNSWCSVLAGVLGSANFTELNYRDLESNFNLASVHGKLLTVINETEASPKEHEKRLAVLKNLTGGGQLYVEKKHRQGFSAPVTTKFVLTMNEIPSYQDKQSSVRARMIPLGFEQSFVGARPAVEPYMQVLRSKAGLAGCEPWAIATLAARFWEHQREKGNPFEFSASRAQQRGSAVVEAMDVVGTVVSKYLRVKKGKTIEIGAIVAACEALAAHVGVEIRYGRGGNISGLLESIERAHPAAIYKKSLSRAENTRGFLHLEFDRAQLLADYRDISESDIPE